MKQSSLYCGLVFDGKAAHALNRFSQLAAAGLRQSGDETVRISLLTGLQARITSEKCLIKLRIRPAVPQSSKRRFSRPSESECPLHKPARFRVEAQCTPLEGSTRNREDQERLLLRILHNMVRASNADQVEWLTSKTVLPAKRFLDSLDDIAEAPLVPELMPNFAPLALNAYQTTKKPDQQPDLTLSRELRDVLIANDDERGEANLSDWAKTSISALAEALPMSAARSALARLGTPALRLREQPVT